MKKSCNAKPSNEKLKKLIMNGMIIGFMASMSFQNSFAKPAKIVAEKIDKVMQSQANNACKRSDAKGFLNALGYSRALAAQYFAKEINIIEYINNDKNHPIKSKIKASNYIYPISLYDFFWVKTQKNINDKPVYLLIEINQSASNHINIDFQELEKAPPQDSDEGEFPKFDYEKTYKSIAFRPKGNCWELFEQRTFWEMQ